MKAKTIVLSIGLILFNNQVHALGWKDLVEAGCGALFVGVEFGVSNPEGKALAEAGKGAMVGFAGDLGCGAVGGLLDDKPVNMEEVKQQISSQINENEFKMYKDRFQNEVDGYELLLQDDREFHYDTKTRWDHLSGIDEGLRKHIPALERQARHDATSIWIYSALARLHLGVLNQLALYAAADSTLGRNPDAWVQTWATYQLRYATFTDLVASEVFSQLEQKADFIQKKKALADNAPFQCTPKEGASNEHNYFLLADGSHGNAMKANWESIDTFWPTAGSVGVGWQPREVFDQYGKNFNSILNKENWTKDVETFNMRSVNSYFRWIDKDDHEELTLGEIQGKGWFKDPWVWCPVYDVNNSYCIVYYVPGEEFSHRAHSIGGKVEKATFHLPKDCLAK